MIIKPIAISLVASLAFAASSRAQDGMPVAIVADQPQPFPLLNPPKDITPAKSRQPYSWSPPNPHKADIPGRPPRRTWTTEERKAYESRVAWFHQAKYGLFFHYLSGGKWTPEEWSAWVDKVDVEKVADQAKQLGAGYVILTLGQNQIYACAPNPVIAKHWGPQYTSTRDLPMDVYKALEKRGIPMMLYFATDNQHRMPRPPEVKGNARFDLWLEAAQWYSDHYGRRCKGWWVDGLYEFVKDYNINMHKALNHGNPDALVSSGWHELSDFTHGHCGSWAAQKAYSKPFYGRWDPDFKIQWHAFQYVGPTWGAPGANKPRLEFVQYATDIIKGGGVITFDVGTFTQGCFYRLPADCKTGKKPDGTRIGPYLEIQRDQFKVLEAVRDAVKDIKPSSP